jgi:hypothetical protein
LELINILLSQDSTPEIICLQDLWQFSDFNTFSLPGYNLSEYKLRRDNIRRGGAGIYVRLNLKYPLLPQKLIFVDKIFESIFIEVESSPNSKYITGSVYSL